MKMFMYLNHLGGFLYTIKANNDVIFKYKIINMMNILKNLFLKTVKFEI